MRMEKYATNRVPLVALKKVMTQWQDKMHECNGWNSLYWCNHDQARAVTRFGNDSEEYREISAKNAWNMSSYDAGNSLHL